MGERFPRAAWVPIAGGLAWLWCAGHFGVFGFLCAVVPGALLLSSGVGTLLYPGDIRIPEFAALGGFVGALLAVPVLFVAGLGMGALLLALSVAGFVAAGHVAVLQEPATKACPIRSRACGSARRSRRTRRCSRR